MNDKNKFFKNKYLKKFFGFIALTSVAFFGMVLLSLPSEKEVGKFVLDNLKIALFIGFLLIFVTPFITKLVDDWVIKKELNTLDLFSIKNQKGLTLLDVELVLFHLPIVMINSERHNPNAVLIKKAF